MHYSNKPSVLILGTRGLPARHGGFETFAERLARFLSRRGWDVTVYCQPTTPGKLETDFCDGIRLVHIPTKTHSPFATMVFDWRSILHAASQPGVPLILGYNTAIFAVLLRAIGRPVLINMDGLEWKRRKWSWFARAWLYINEWMGSLAASTLIADHPEIAKRYKGRRQASAITTICYGADEIREADDAAVRALGLEPGKYFLSVGRIEPENTVLEMVSAYANLDTHIKFVYVGKLDPSDPYHAAIVEQSRGRVLFAGAIYNKEKLNALRFHCLAFCHGHTVGGTNPSLVEALGARSAVIAHDNPFNRWVAGEHAAYFSDAASFVKALKRAETDEAWVEQLRLASQQQFRTCFHWPVVLEAYEQLLRKCNYSPRGEVVR